MSDQYEYFDEDGNALSAEEVAALGDDVEIIEEVVESDEPMELIEAHDEVPSLDDFEIPEMPLDGGEQSAPAPAVVDHRELEEPVEIIEIDEPASPSLATEPEPVLEAPVEPQADSPVTLNRRAKLALAGGAATVVLLVGGGIAFALNGIGDQNTAQDVKAGAQSQYAKASEKVASKSSEVRGEASSAAIDTCRTGRLAGPGGLGDAMADGSSEKPRLRLDVISSAPLPGAFIAARTNADGKTGTPSLLQLTKSSWGAYTTVPLTKAEKKAETDRPGFHKADVTVGDDSIKVTGDRVWAGGDQGGAGSCEPGEPGVYATGEGVPSDAAGLVDGTASVDAIQGIAGEPDRAVAIMGNSVALVKLAENLEEGGDASSSSAPSK